MRKFFYIIRLFIMAHDWLTSEEIPEKKIFNFDLRGDELRVVDPVLTQIAHGYSNRIVEFVARKIFRLVQVVKEKGKVLTFTKENFVVRDTVRAMRGPSNRIPPTAFSYIEYELLEHDQELSLDTREIAEANSAIRLESRTVRELTDTLALGQEKEVADYLQDNGNFNNTTTLLAAGSWISADNRDVLNDFRVARAAIKADIGRLPNTCVMAYDVFEELIAHQNIIDKVQYSGLAEITKDILASLLGFKTENFHVGVSDYTIDSLAASTLTPLWTNTCIIAYVDQAEEASEYNPSIGYTLQQNGKPEVDTYLENGGKMKVIRNTDMYDVLPVQMDCAYLYDGCLD